jgi:putative ABC transport system substrate-binding protein
VAFVLKSRVHIWLITFLVIFGCSGMAGVQARRAAPQIRMVVIKSRDIPFYASAVQGLIEGLKSKGYRKGDQLDLKIVALSGKADGDTSLIEAQVASKPDLIVTLGTDATRLTAAQKPAMPVLFCMVLDPVSMGVTKSLENPGSNFTGVTLSVRPGKQLETLLLTAPKVRRIGLLYTDHDPTSMAFLADAVADAKPLNVEIVAIAVPSSQSARDALKQFSTNPPDAIWLLPDLASSAPQPLKETLEYAQAHHIPVLGMSSATVHAGALVALSANVEDQGSSVAEMAVHILAGTETAAQMKVRGPRRTVLTINLVASRQLGIAIPKEQLHQADEVVDVDQEDK